MKVIVKDYEVMTPQQRRELTPTMLKMCGKIEDAVEIGGNFYTIYGFFFDKDMVIVL